MPADRNQDVYLCQACIAFSAETCIVDFSLEFFQMKRIRENSLSSRSRCPHGYPPFQVSFLPTSNGSELDGPSENHRSVFRAHLEITAWRSVTK